MGANIFNNSTTLYISFATLPHGDGDEVQETTFGVDEKVDNVNETLGNKSQHECIAVVNTIRTLV